jgi:hypothetical protein
MYGDPRSLPNLQHLDGGRPQSLSGFIAYAGMSVRSNH